jgi:integrase
VTRVYAHDNPVAGIDKVKVKGGDVEIFTPVEIARLLAAADEKFLPVLAIAAFAGLRSAEIERLEWANVNFTERFIEVGKEKSKTRSRRTVPISDNLFAWLQSYSQEQGNVWKGSHDDFYDAQQDTAAATEVKEDPEKKVKAVDAVKWKQNGCRHSFISYRLAQVGDAAKVSLEAGNTPKMVFQHYRQVVNEKQAAAWFAVSPTRQDNVTTLPAESLSA